MKNIITLSLLAFSLFGYSQKQYKRADNFFEKMWYIEAAKEYEAAIEQGDNSKEVLQKAGDAYYFNTNMEGAYKWYDILISEYGEDVEVEYLFRYAHSLQGIGDNKSAKKWMKKFSQKANQNDPRGQKYSQERISIEDVLELPEQFTLKNLKINTSLSDFGPMYFKDRLVYSSAVDSSTYHTRKYRWNEQPYLNMLIGEINGTQTDVTFTEEFSKELNTIYHEATLAFSPDQNTIYFTRNNYDGKLVRDDEGINHLKLYTAQLREDTYGNVSWANVQELPFNSNEYSVGHPTVSKDGKKLYFVSDMPGSIGATDIFVVDILGENKYSQPKNLGPNINTYGREMFPYITDKALYFASDGHLGLGGLDVFESKTNEGNFTIPVNLGAPLNSNLDDFGYIVNEETNKGYVCSNRKTGKGDDDIYSFVRTPIEICDQKITGQVTNTATGQSIAQAKLTLISGRGEVLEETMSNEQGEYTFKYKPKCGSPYEIKAEKLGHNTTTTPFETQKGEGETNVPIALETVNKLIVEQGGVLKIKIGIIYFDLDKSFIRNDAASELNKIVLLMNEYPNMVIKVESHTDSRSSKEYNRDLSDRRAKSTREYIVSQNIEADRIESAIGYGESRLINECADGVSCSEARHQLNRRSEFIIIKM
ncbi:OmpA family protein [Aquimarina algicola]|uniref:Flagellar motor protein MotB n=1 Tax=Aquimarina algicola TaxID=2589995 RepID=A0A504J1H6_9FLAO|nr:OmpA family protein [Aquimarina algicola]TPN82332.1 flagellar motor protein MotB [Aquimarina algicola]